MSPRVAPHHHKCQSCGAKTECGGTWEENYDGVPEVICREFHLPGGVLNDEFLCMACLLERAREDDIHRPESHT